MNDDYPNFFVLQVFQRLPQCLNRPLYIRFNQQVEIFDLTSLNLLEQIFQRNFLGLRHRFRLGFRQTFFGNGPGRLFIQNRQYISRLRYIGQTDHFHGSRRTGFFDFFPTVVGHCPHLAIGGSGQNRIANPERAVLDQYGRHRPFAFIQFRFHNGSDRRSIRIGLQILNLGDQQYHFQQFTDPGFLHCGYRNHDRIAAP